MSCQDVCITQDFDPGHNAFYSETQVRAARKPHRCCECGGEIAVGQPYERANGMTDGWIWSNATCAPCQEIRKAFICSGWVFEQLWESIREELFPRFLSEGPFECLAKLETEPARALLLERFESWSRGE